MLKKLFIGLFIVILLVSAIFYYRFYDPSNTQVIGFSDEDYLIIEDNLIDRMDPILFDNNILYFNFNIIKEYIDPNIFFDEIENTVIYTDNNKVKKYKIGELKGQVNNKEFLIDNPVKEINGGIYIPINLFIEDYEIDINYFEETGAVVLDYKDISYLEGEIILENGVIRTDLDIKSPIIWDNINIGDILYIYGEYENWYKVRTLNGIPGFMEKKFIKLNHTKDIYKTELKERTETISPPINKISLTWDYTYGKLKDLSGVGPIQSVNVISPTWFSILDNEGKIQDKGNHEYVRRYREIGYEIWPLIDNSFDPDLTGEVLKTSSSRERLINNILNLYLDYDFQGINIDFENVHLKDKDLLTQFVRELYPIFKEHNLTVSMDITSISTSENWSLSFDRSRLSETTDYLILMAYDQHWASSPIAGSVAQYTWVESGLKRVLKEVPKEKLVLAVPFYSRLWITEDGKLSSQALSMNVANNFIEKNNIDLSWDDESGQYYGETTMDTKDYQIWLENAQSLSLKASLIHKYDLAGIASWRKGFETLDIWQALDKVLN